MENNISLLLNKLKNVDFNSIEFEDFTDFAQFEEIKDNVERYQLKQDNIYDEDINNIELHLKFLNDIEKKYFQ